MNEDPLGPARGCAWGALIGIAAWAAIIWTVILVYSTIEKVLL